MSKPTMLMLLGRNPFAERSGRAVMLRQRIEQARQRFETHIVVVGHASGDASDEGLHFLPMANPAAIALNALRMSGLPLQTWLYHSAHARAEIAARVRETGARAIFIDMLRLAPLAGDVPRSVARLVDYDDLLSERYRLAASAEDYDVMGFLARRVGPLAPAARAVAGPLLHEEARRCAAYEHEMLVHADLVLFTSPREAQMLAREGVHVLAAPPLLAPHPRTDGVGERLIFLGNLRYAENIVMLRALADAVSALEQQGELPEDVTLDIVGEHAPDLPHAFDAKRFRFIGRIPDLATLAGAGIFLAPVIGGTGVKLKVLDGLALGCPVVATGKALEGLSARANRDMLVGESVKDVLRAAIALRSRTALKAKLAARGRAYLERAHAPALGDAIAEAMAKAVERAGARQETL
ncbi:MAG: glycosyltransferase [Hyphomonadaceae bacterium]|nr:glycosyltransferase [Hyphomonadaceae bacterium]